MTDENANTADLTIDEKLNLILKRLDGVETRLGSLEAQNAGNTRPLLDQIIKEMTETRDGMNTRLDTIEKQLRGIDRRFSVFAEDIGRMRADIRDFDERLTELERRPN